MYRIVLGKVRVGVFRGTYIQAQGPPDFCARVRNVLVQVEASLREPFQAPTRRVNGISSATRWGVQYASRARRSSISEGYAA